MSTLSGSSAPVPPDSFLPPSTGELAGMLPHYDIGHLIAAGGMGAVYAGVQRALDRPVAIKILPPGAARDGESIERFRTEAKAMARLIHPNIPAVYDFDVSSGYCYLVMELIDGWNVHQLIAEKLLNPDLTYGFLSQVCDALHFAHQRGIIHGDIKPSNLLVTQEGVVKLADFGLAQLAGAGAAAAENDSPAPMGYPEYAAPELWQPGVVMDHRADLYSVGCVFHEMLTGAPPAGEFQLPSAALKLDPRVDTVIARCLQPDPALRYQSADEIKRVVEAIRQPAPGSGPAKPAVRIMRPPPRRNKGTPARRAPHKKKSGSSLLLWLLLPAAAAAAWLLMNAKPPPQTGPSAPVPSPVVPPFPDKTKAPAPAQASASVPATAPVEPPPGRPPSPQPSGTATPAVPEQSTPPSVTLSPETKDKLMAFRAKYRAEWQNAAAGKLQTERDRIAAQYTAALEKLREEFSKIGDAPALLALRNETDRFNRDQEGLPDGQLSPDAKLAALQKTLSAALVAAGAKVKPAADQIRERCLLRLKEIESEAPPGDQAALSTLYDDIVSTPDLAPLLVP